MEFHPVENSGATAEIIVPILMDRYKPESVLDLGCNTGWWLYMFGRKVHTAVGVDGHNMIPGLVIPPRHFVPADLTIQLDLNRKFDLVLCLEVAEHLDEKYADVLIDNCIRHSDTIFWSAATPGQGGYHHVNEQPHAYWIEKFKLKGYEGKVLTYELPEVPHEYYRKNAIEFKKIAMYKSQNNEAELAINYFGDREITILDVGANDGITFSNSYDLIQRGNKAYLFEPSSVFSALAGLYKENPNVRLYNKGIGSKLGILKFYESGAHVKGGSDRALVSTTDFNETQRWRKSGVQFTERSVQIVDFRGWWDFAGSPELELISIDVEGMEWEILKQIDLRATATEMLIIEWNGDKGLEKKFTEHCNKYGLKEYSRNAENLIFALLPPAESPYAANKV